MANVYGVNYTKFNTPTPTNKVDGSEVNARVRWIHDKYEASAKAQGTVIYMAKLPNGARVLPESRLYHDALGANSALSVGTVASPASLAASTATTSAGSIALGAVDTFTSAVSTETAIVVTVSGTGAITGTIELSLYYAAK